MESLVHCSNTMGSNPLCSWNPLCTVPIRWGAIHYVHGIPCALFQYDGEQSIMFMESLVHCSNTMGSNPLCSWNPLCTVPIRWGAIHYVHGIPCALFQYDGEQS